MTVTPHYRKMYAILFNAITDAMRDIEDGHVCLAYEHLRKAQLKTEEMYIDAGEEE